MTTPFLVDPPRPGIDRVEGILLLDVDGVLNILDENVDHEKLPTVPGSSGRPLPINLIDEAILEVLDGLLRPVVWLGWLTTWGFRVSRLEGLLNARLRGGFVVTERPALWFAPAEWKYDAAVRLAHQHPGAPIAWADDDAIPAVVRYGSLSQRIADAVLVAPDPHVGLALDDAERIAAHLGASAHHIALPHDRCVSDVPL